MAGVLHCGRSSYVRAHGYSDVFDGFFAVSEPDQDTGEIGFDRSWCVTANSEITTSLFAGLMNSSHAALTDWALAHIQVGSDAAVLDVGCGGGRTIEKLAGMAALVYGIDYAAGSVVASRGTTNG